MKRLRPNFTGDRSRRHRPFLAIIAIATASMLGCVQPLFSQTNLATLAPDGAWTWFNDPRAPRLQDHGRPSAEQTAVSRGGEQAEDSMGEENTQFIPAPFGPQN